jgi:ACT domain-containing protein
VAGESLFSEFKNKAQIYNAIKEVQLSRSTVTKRVECKSGDIEQQLRQDVEIRDVFSPQLDE